MPLEVSYDPLNRPVAPGALKTAYEEIKQYPIELSPGQVYQFTTIDEATMRKTARGLTLSGGSVAWRLLDNSEVIYDGITLATLADDLELLQIQRGLVIDAEYVALKSVPVLTERILADWKNQYVTGFIP